MEDYVNIVATGNGKKGVQKLGRKRSKAVIHFDLADLEDFGAIKKYFCESPIFTDNNYPQ